MAHVVVANIFMMNYLIAVLNMVYTIMTDDGDFFTISYQYLFINKYLSSMMSNSGYEELILYPPPLNFLIVPMFLVSPSKCLVLYLSKFY